MKTRISLMVLMLLLILTSSASAWSWTSTEGKDGVCVYYPNTGWTWTEGSDGRRVVYPTSGWTWTEGSNGRRVIYPSSGWTWTEGSDGRRIVYPASGWTWTEGRNGRRIIYPASGWTWTEGNDGRRIAYPSSGWTWREEPDGRRVAYQIDGDPYLRAEDLIYDLLVARIPFTYELRPFDRLLIEQMGINYPTGIYDPELRRAHAMLNSNDFYGARQLFRKVAHTGSTSEIRRDASYYIGYTSAQLEDYWQAISEFKNFLNQYDQAHNTRLIPEALYTLGILHEYIGRNPDAANYYRNCATRFPQTQMAVQSQQRLTLMNRTYRYFNAANRADSTLRNTDVSLVNNSMNRRNPLFNRKPDSAKIARVCQFIYAVDRMSESEKALKSLTASDKRLETVKNYIKILAEKSRFESLHQQSTTDF